MTYTICTKLQNPEGFRKTGVARVTYAGHLVHVARRRSTISWAAKHGAALAAADWIAKDRKRRNR
jgi:hypothetical protein